MATARPAPSWGLLDSVVRLHKVGERTEPDWAVIECSETRAYVTLYNWHDRPDGTSPFRLSPFDGLELLVRVADDPPYPTALSIRLHGDPDKDVRRGTIGGVLLADGGFVVLSSCLPDTRGSSSYIVFDAANASLAMIRANLSLTFLLPVTYTPLPIRRADGGGYVLALLASDANRKDVVCLMPSPLPFDQPWQLKPPLFPPEKPAWFNADEEFSSQGRAFWVSLDKGVLFCDHQDLLSSSSDNVRFSYIALPLGCEVAFDPTFRTANPSKYRTMRCVGDSLRFVSIEGYTTVHSRDMVLCMWTLVIPSSSSSGDQWRKAGEICVGRLREQEGFKNARLPTHRPPTKPMLSSHEDGVVYFMLSDRHKGEDAAKYIYVFSVNMFTGRFVSSWRLPSSCAPHSDPQFLMGSDILEHIKI